MISFFMPPWVIFGLGFDFISGSDFDGYISITLLWLLQTGSCRVPCTKLKEWGGSTSPHTNIIGHVPRCKEQKETRGRLSYSPACDNEGISYLLRYGLDWWGQFYAKGMLLTKPISVLRLISNRLRQVAADSVWLSINHFGGDYDKQHLQQLHCY